MASVSITRRRTSSGPRYIVRYRLGGRAYPITHGGSFARERDAKTRRDFIAGELAAGRNPADALRAMAMKPVVRTIATIADEWLATRIDLKASTRDTYRDAIKWLKASDLAGRDPSSVTSKELQTLVTSSGLTGSSLQTYMSPVKQIFDFAGVDPNPARGRRVRLPRTERAPIVVPLRAHIETIIASVKAVYRLALHLLDETGVRVGELLAWTWGDVDIHGSQILVREGKTKSARRWVPILPARMDELLATCPPDSRSGDRRLFQFGESTLRGVMLRACQNAGIPHYSPHDFRHRYISVLLKQGLSRAEVAELVGHSNTNELATYEHVVFEDA
jgi:integrase